jgi:hypothetical protein
MKTIVRAGNLAVDRQTRERIEARFTDGLHRVAHRVLRVEIRLQDLNGPRGGEDIACLAEVRLRSAGKLFVEARDADLARAVSRAAEKAAMAAARMLERHRELRRRGPSVRAGLAANRGKLAGPLLT